MMCATQSPAPPQLKIQRRQFARKQEVLSDLIWFDTWPVTTYCTPVTAGALHAHQYDLSIYVLAGSLLLHTAPTEPPLVMRARDKVEIPAGCLHALAVPEHTVIITAFPDPESALSGLCQSF